MNLWVIFLTGLTVGGLTCLAVQGGLLASVIAAREEELRNDIKRHAIFATGVFLLSKLLAYILLGFILGAFGEVLNIGGSVQTFMQLLAGIYMIAVSLNLLNIHPVFRYAIIQPPRFLTRLVRNQSKSKDIFAPALLGAMTVFIPCGTTLAIEALAISSANPMNGAVIMAAFILGTVPLFFSVGFVTSLLGDAFRVKFLKLAAVAVMYLGLVSVNGAFIALGFPLNSQTISDAFSIPVRQQEAVNTIDPGNIQTTQNPEILITNGGYSPNYIRVKKDEKVTLTLINRGSYSCAAAFRIPSYGIGRNVRPDEKATITFTPKETGKIAFSCSMGMYTGVIEVL